MSISSISASPRGGHAHASQTHGGQQQPALTPAPSNDNDADDSSSSPPAQPPLPPGQGTRIDQLA